MFYLLKSISIVISKTTIDYNNILIKVQVSYIGAVRDDRTHSKRPECIKDSERYYIVFTLCG